MNANCTGNGRNADGKFAMGNPGNPGHRNGGGDRTGVPNKASFIRQQILEACGDKALENLKKLGESADRADQDVFWKIVGKSLPQQIQAEVGTIGSLGAECDAARWAGQQDQDRTRRRGRLRLRACPTRPSNRHHPDCPAPCRSSARSAPASRWW